MSNYKYLILSFIGLLSFTACEDVIELDLEDTEPQIVIEATLNTSTQTAQVLLTKTNEFYDNGATEGVANAIINLQHNNGTNYLLTEIAKGIYQATDIAANPEETFSISIETEDAIYTASAKVPYPAALESLESETVNLPFGGNGEGIRIYADWADPANVDNFYRLRPVVNDTLMMNFYALIDDEFNDGEIIRVPLMEAFTQGNIVQIELLSVSEQYYNYFQELSTTVANGPNGATPFNPRGNFDKGALGYFGIYTSSSLEIEL